MASMASSVPKEKIKPGNPRVCIVTTEYSKAEDGKWTEWRNVKWGPWQRMNIPALDQTTVYGFGLFEGINFYTGKDGKPAILFLEEHLDRFYKGMELAHMEMPISRDELKRLIFETILRSGLKEGYIRPILTAGVGKDGTLGIGTKREKPSIIIDVCRPIALYGEEVYKNGTRIASSAFDQPGKNVLNFKFTIKWTDYFLNILVKEEAKRRGYDDGIMQFEKEGKKYVSELSAANMFYIKDGALYTPSLESNRLDGITARAVIGIAKKRGMKVVEKDCTLEDFKGADEAFATGTAAGIIAIAEIDGVKVGDGREGRFTHELRGAYNEQVTPENLTPVPDVTKKFGDLKPADYQDLSTGFNEAYRKAMGKLAKKARKEAARKA